MLYCRCGEKAYLWEGHLAKLESFLEKESRFQIASPYTYLYFFSSSQDDQFESLESWVAKEIIGPPMEIEEESGLALYDLERGSCFSCQGPKDLFSFREIWCKESDMRQFLQKDFNLADTWRLRLEKVGTSMHIDFQFFPL